MEIPGDDIGRDVRAVRQEARGPFLFQISAAAPRAVAAWRHRLVVVAEAGNA